MKVTGTAFTTVLMMAVLPAATLASRCSPPPHCEGTLEPLIVDFEVNEKGQPFKAGDTPRNLPGKIDVTGKRRARRIRNDLMIFDTANPTGQDEDLANPHEGNVLIVSEDNDSTDPDDNGKGGVIQFSFREPVYQVNSIKFLDIEERRNGSRGVVKGRSIFNSRSTTSVPVGGNGQAITLALDNWYGIEFLQIRLAGSGAIAELELTVCRPRRGEEYKPPVIVEGN